MSSYADRMLAEAVDQSGHTPGAARRILLDRIAIDDRLLRELVTPFLTGIVGHAIDKALAQPPKRQAAPPKAAPAPMTTTTTIRQPAHQITRNALDSLVKTLGENFAATPNPIGARVMPAPRAMPASSHHAETMRSLAKAHINGRAKTG